MKVLPPDASDAEILAACRDWVQRVADGDLAGAIEMLHVPQRYEDPQRWTARSLEIYVCGEGFSRHGGWVEGALVTAAVVGGRILGD